MFKTETYSLSLLCFMDSLYLKRKFLLMSVVSFSCLFFDNEAGNKSADSEKKRINKLNSY